MGVVAREVETLREALRGWVAVARRLWAARPSATRSVAIAFVAAVALSGAASVVSQARLPHRLPSARDWAALRSLLEREARPGDAAALSPPWAERAREALPAALPVLAARRYAGEDLLGVRRVWLVSVPRAPGFSWEPEEDLLARGAPAGAPARLGALEVRRLQLPFPMLPLSFLPDRLATAGAATAVREVREIAGAPRPCLVARVGAADPVALRSTPVRVGRVVRGHVGAIGADALPGAVRVAVGVDGEEAGTAEISGAGFVPFQVDTTRFAGQVRPISLRVSAGDAGAELCLDAATLP